MPDITLGTSDGKTIVLSQPERVTVTMSAGLSGKKGDTGPVDTAYTDAQIAALFRDSDITVTVGSGGDYATVNAAIEYLSRLKPTYTNDGFSATINLLTGFVMAEQVFVRGIDLSWITITSVDAEVSVTAAAITVELINEDNVTPIIGGIDHAHLPILDVLFAYPDQGDGYAASPKDGIVVANSSHVLFKPGAGVKRPRNGIRVLYGSSATCYMPGMTQPSGAGTVTGVDFSYATGRAIMVSFGSKANMARSIIHHSKGDYGIYVIWGSHGDFHQSQVHDSLGNAITCRDGSFANMRETNVARSRRGYHALHNGRINARNHAGIWSVDGAKDCTQYGVLASANSHIDADEVDVSGSVIGVNASNASSINFYEGIANNCATRGVSAVEASTIDAQDVSADSCGIGFYSQAGSTINAMYTNANSCTNIGYYAYFGSTINADTSSANTCTTDGYRADEASLIQARNSSANTAGVYGFNANRGSTINARGSSATGCVVGFLAFEGSNINAQSTTAASAATWGYSVDRGSRINAGAITGTTNQAVNTLTGLGLISDAALPMATDASVVHIAGAETITGLKKFAPGTNGAGALQVTRADGTTNVLYVDTTSTTPKVLIGVGSTPGSTLNVNGPSYFGGGSGVASSFADFAPSTTTSASARFRSGVDPTSPNSGEMWFDGTDLKFRNGATTNLLAPKSYVDSGLSLKQNLSDGWRIASSGAASSLTGTLTETALATINIPAGALGPNGMIRLTMNFSCTNNANTKTARARFDGISGTQYLNSPLVSQARLHTPIFIYNRNSQTSQIGGTNAGNQAGYGQSTSAQVTSSVDTTVATTIVITGQLGVITDSITLESCLLEYHYQA